LNEGDPPSEKITNADHGSAGPSRDFPSRRGLINEAFSGG